MREHGLAGAGGEAPASSVLGGATRITPYAYYALFLLILANFLNYVDRQIVSILGQRIKEDLGLDDAQLGFLLGTAFAVLYGVAGIAMGRISDIVNRCKLMAAAIAFWSGMTALSGMAGGFATMALSRIGVGFGEAAANPSSHSLLSDYFPPRNRAAALGSYLLGVHLGGATSLILGAAVLQHWDSLCAVFPGDACRVTDWRAGFLIVAVPGFILALLIANLREPPRPQHADAARPFRVAGRELSAAVPPFTLFNLHQAGGAGSVAKNLAMAAALALGAVVLGQLLDDWPQWIAIAVGAYSVLSWRQVMTKRDRPLYAMTFGCPTFVLMMIGGGLTACFTTAVMAWSPPYALRTFDASTGQVGLYLGVAAATAGGMGVVGGGLIADRWKRRDPRAPMWVTMIALFVPAPILVLMMQAQSLETFVAGYFFFMLFAQIWSGGIGAACQDLVLPRMRGAAAAAFSLVMVLMSASAGPYTVGKVSTLTGSLATGLLSVLVFVPLGGLTLYLAARRLPHETPEGRLRRASAAGEP